MDNLVKELDLIDTDVFHFLALDNVIIFGVDMSLSTKNDNRKKGYFNSRKWSNTGITKCTKC